MGLMYGNGPLGKKPAGTFNFEPPPPGRALYLEPTPKRVRVEVGGETIADSRRAMMLHESGLQPVYYFRPEDVRADVVAELEPSDTVTRCPYKATAGYYSVNGAKDLVWYYEQPLAEVGRIQGLLCFFNERVDLELDGELQECPETAWSRAFVRRRLP